ncbi:hypothetical protein DUNSADRAFT_7934 [Dunaliella salina]|uniref:Encoded protein n=1 Tax=Dunaliella salina TaxID=3046 RepID=A0ABQ7H646_DUNSA|nr:hypothetical protein DUNSADRAFT_7934 [Dunaliella salina]|eukprot:KAF5842281.1 hypothetical protein DUNSADRAFT_7934 [Dunaliella salina]
MLDDPTRTSPAPSVLSALHAKHSSSHGVHLASPERNPHAALPGAGSNGHPNGIDHPNGNGHPNSNSLSSGNFSARNFRAPSKPLRRTGPSRMRPSVKKGGTGEALLVIGEEGVGPRPSSSHHKSLLMPPSKLPSISEDDNLHRLSSTP